MDANKVMQNVRNMDREVHRTLMRRRGVTNDWGDQDGYNSHAAYEAGVVDLLRGYRMCKEHKTVQPGAFGPYRNAYNAGVNDARDAIDASWESMERV